MKKIIILITSMIFILTVGCTNSEVKRADTLEIAYFNILDKRIDKEEITKKYITNLLKEYEYEKGEPLIMEGGNTDGSDYIQQPYIFKNNNEILTLTHTNYEGNESIEPLYSIENENTCISLSYMVGIEEDEESNRNNFMVIITGNDIDVHHKVANRLPNSSSNWSEIYQRVSENIASSKDVNIEDIKNIIKEEPSIEEYQDTLEIYQNEPILSIMYNLIGYNFENDDEILNIEYIKEKNQIWNVYYFDKNTITSKNTIDKPLINNKEKFHTGLATYVETKEVQQELLHMLQIQ